MSGIKHPLALHGQLAMATLVDLGRREAAEARVVVLLVVPGYEAAQKSAGVFGVLETSRVFGLVL